MQLEIVYLWHTHTHTHTHTCTGLFEMIVRSYSPGHLVLQMQPHVISFYGVTSKIRFPFHLFPQVSRNWRYESEPPLKPSPLTCYRQFGTNSNIVLFLLRNNQQMQLYAMNFIPLLSSLYMFRVPHTPTIRSTMFNCINCTSGCRYSWTLYSWWWACVAPETCRVNLAVE